MRRSLDAMYEKAAEVGCESFERGDDRAGASIGNFLALFVEEQAQRLVRLSGESEPAAEPAPAPVSDW